MPTRGAPRRRLPVVLIGVLAAAAGPGAGIALSAGLTAAPEGLVVASRGAARVDPRTLALARLPGAPAGVQQVAATAGAVWLAGRGPTGDAVTVTRMAGSGRARSTSIPGTVDVLGEAASRGGDWVIALMDTQVRRLYRVDDATLDVVQVALDGIQPLGLAADGGGVWVLGAPAGPLARVDERGHLVARVPLSRTTTALTSVAGGALLGTTDGRIVRVAHGRVVRAAPTTGTPFVMAAGGGSAYVAAVDAHAGSRVCWTLSRIDPLRLSASSRRRVCGPAMFTVAGLAVAGRDLWVLESPRPDRYRLRRLDAATLAQRALAPLPGP